MFTQKLAGLLGITGGAIDLADRNVSLPLLLVDLGPKSTCACQRLSGHWAAAVLLETPSPSCCKVNSVWVTWVVPVRPSMLVIWCCIANCLQTQQLNTINIFHTVSVGQKFGLFSWVVLARGYRHNVSRTVRRACLLCGPQEAGKLVLAVGRRPVSCHMELHRTAQMSSQHDN